MAELDVQVHARERRAARVDARPVQVLLHQDLGHEVADLRAHHRDRVAVRRVALVHKLPVGRVRDAHERLMQERRAERAVVGNRLRRRRVGIAQNDGQAVLAAADDDDLAVRRLRQLERRFDAIAFLLLHEIIERFPNRHTGQHLVLLVAFGMTHDVWRKIARQNQIVLA